MMMMYPPPPSPGLIEISTVERGVVSLYGVTSELFVAMNSRGRLYGTVSYASAAVLDFPFLHCPVFGHLFSWRGWWGPPPPL